MGKIYEHKTPMTTIEITLDYTKENTYYLTIVAYGDIINEEFNSEEQLTRYLKDEWNFTSNNVIELLSCMYRFDD